MTYRSDILLQIGLLAASAVLAIGPVIWLVQSWHDPSYQSHGAVYAGLMLGIILWSATSGPARAPTRAATFIPLFLLAAALRLIGQVLAINVVGALALAIDVFAVAVWLRLDARPRAVSPVWLAIVFLFALPLAPILERIAGFPLQLISAELACRMLGWMFADVSCAGVRLKVDGVDVLVDLPCSGASGLLLMMAFWAALNVLYRPKTSHALVGGAGVLLAALCGNALRITLLAGGLAKGIDTMGQPLHDLIGLASLAASAIPVLLLYRPKPATQSSRGWRLPALPRVLHIPSMVAALGLSLAIVDAPQTPLDRSAPIDAQPLPRQLLGHSGQNVPLSPTEARYFASFGGQATKAQYGPLGLNVVQTGSPLRHLHAPATCLLGMGYDVRFLGTRFDPVPTSIYEATAPDGQVWHVAVSYVSDRGAATASVGHAVWSWLNGASHQWRSVQRITPVSLTHSQRAAFDAAVLAALDI